MIVALNLTGVAEPRLAPRRRGRVIRGESQL
jgi:hypothetical protein